MQIDFVYDASVANAPAGLETGLAAAAAYLDGLITNPITVTIQVGWGENDGSAIPAGELASGGPTSGIGMSYGTLEAQLAKAATSPADQSVVANLPTADPTGGGSFFVSSAQEKAWGLLPPTAPGIDGSIGFSTSYGFTFDPNARAEPGLYDFIGIAEHEITHALGRFAGLQYAPGWYSPMDLVRYAAPGDLALASGEASYASIDGGRTELRPFDSSPGGDLGDWASSVPDDPFGYSRPDQVEPMSATDITMMDALGYNTAGTPPPATAVSDLATGTATPAAGTPSTGASSGITQGSIRLSPDNLHVVSHTHNAFIVAGCGNDTVDASQANDNNGLEGGGGSNFLIGGSGTDSFFVDDRNLTAEGWTTVVNLHAGDSLTIRGLAPTDFTPTWLNDRGAPGATGLTGVFRTQGGVRADVTLAGYTTADVGTRLTVAYGNTQSTAGAPGTEYMMVHAV
jgi:hypothetical protein